MSDPARAISILKQARDILNERLIEHLTEHQEAFLSDSLGIEFGGEINSVYEQFGARLLHVNTMLSQLPAPPPEPADLDAAESGDDTATDVAYLTSENPTAGLLAAPKRDDETVAVVLPAAGPVNWETVVGHVQAHKADVGTALLADYFGIDAARAARCTQTFQERVNQTPELMVNAMRLGLELRRGSVNSSIMLLWECFGLQGPEAIAAMQSLKARLSTASG